MTRPNVFTANFTDGFDPNDPDGYRCSEAPFGTAAGGSELLVRLYELPVGQSLCPYHYEYVEEWMMVLVGVVEVRTPDGVSPAVTGDIVCFPAGPEGAHKVWNGGDEAARIVMFSAATLPSVCVYPDSDKIGIDTGDPANRWRFRGAEGHLDYYDGEVAHGA